MMKLCKNLFYQPKYGSNADSVMLKQLFRTVTIVLICLTAITFSTYAFFSSSVASGSNTLKSSRFSSTLKIEKDGALITQGNIQSYRFNVPGVYTVTITANDGTTGTGFCIVDVSGTKYYTQQLGKDVNAPNQERREVSFLLDVKAAATVTFEIHWGTTSYYDSVTDSEFYIKNDPQKTIVINATQGIADDTGDDESAQTEPDETIESTVPTLTEPITEPTEQAHTVQSGESLALIAEKYGTTISRLAVYNDMDDPGIIYPGQIIYIPPADWQIPEDTQPATDTTAAPQ